MVNGQKCRRTSQTCTLLPDLHETKCCLLATLPFRYTPFLHTVLGTWLPCILSKRDLGLRALSAAAPSTPHHSSFHTSSLLNSWVFILLQFTVCVYVAIKVFLRSLHSHRKAVCSVIIQLSWTPS